MKTSLFPKLIAALLLLLGCADYSLAQPAIPTNTYPPLDVWTFTDTTNWTSSYGYAPVSYSNVDISYEGDGTALTVDNPYPAWMQFNVVESDGTTNLAVNEGSVIFWFSPDWASSNLGGAGPGIFGSLIEAGQNTKDASYGWWSLFVGDAGNTIYFAGQTNDGTSATFLSAPISWAGDDFHQVALTYSATNSALYLDGQLATNGAGVTAYPGPDALTNGFFIGSDFTGTYQAHGTFDNLATYTNQLDSNAVSGDYVMSWLFYTHPTIGSNIVQAPSSPGNIPAFDAVTGPGYLVAISTNTGGSCVTSTNVWITNTSTTLGTNGVNLTFTIAGGSNGLFYDVFGTTALVSPITNGSWVWLGQGQQCVTYTITNLTNTTVYLVLGTGQDTDQDGLTDAYELLVSHSNPLLADSSGDGMLDGWKVLWGMNPSTNNPAQSSERANYVYDGTGRLEVLFGANSEHFYFDSESNIGTNAP